MRICFAALLLSQFAWAAMPDFSVECDSLGHHLANPDDIDLVTPAEEARLLRAAVQAAYPRLPSDLAYIAANIGFVILHEPKSFTKNFKGCSAEDDPFYRYPDRTLYHPKRSPHGTIRLAISEKMVRALQLFEQIDGAKYPAARRGADNASFAFIVHELLHAWQYRTKPVADGLKLPSGIDDGLFSTELLEGAKAKVNYEHDAFGLHRTFLDAGDLEALALWMDTTAAANPAAFRKGGQYQILDYETPGWYANRYVRAEIAMLGKGNEFTPGGKLTYYIQYVPAEVVLQLKALNDELAATSGLVASPPLVARVSGILGPWTAYMDPKNPLTGALKKGYTYLAGVEARFWREIARLEAKLAGGSNCGVRTVISGLPRPTP